MYHLESLNRKDLQKLAKEWGVKANIKSEDIREQLVQKGFTRPGEAPGRLENQPPPVPSKYSTLKQESDKKSRQRRNALHVRNGCDDENAQRAAPSGPGGGEQAVPSKPKSSRPPKKETPNTSRSSAATSTPFFTPCANTPSTVSTSMTETRASLPSSVSSRGYESRGMLDTPPQLPPHLQSAGKSTQPARRNPQFSPEKIQPPASPKASPSLRRVSLGSSSSEDISSPKLADASTVSNAQPANHIADVPATAAALQRLKNTRTTHRPAVPAHLLDSSQAAGAPKQNHSQGTAASAQISSAASTGEKGSGNATAKPVRPVPAHLKKSVSSPAGKKTQRTLQASEVSKPTNKVSAALETPTSSRGRKAVTQSTVDTKSRPRSPLPAHVLSKGTSPSPIPGAQAKATSNSLTSSHNNRSSEVAQRSMSAEPTPRAQCQNPAEHSPRGKKHTDHAVESSKPEATARQVEGSMHAATADAVRPTSSRLPRPAVSPSHARLLEPSTPQTPQSPTVGFAFPKNDSAEPSVDTPTFAEQRHEDPYGLTDESSDIEDSIDFRLIPSRHGETFVNDSAGGLEATLRLPALSNESTACSLDHNTSEASADLPQNVLNGFGNPPKALDSRRAPHRRKPPHPASCRGASRAQAIPDRSQSNRLSGSKPPSQKLPNHPVPGASTSTSSCSDAMLAMYASSDLGSGPIGDSSNILEPPPMEASDAVKQPTGSMKVCGPGSGSEAPVKPVSLAVLFQDQSVLTRALAAQKGTEETKGRAAREGGSMGSFLAAMSERPEVRAHRTMRREETATWLARQRSELFNELEVALQELGHASCGGGSSAELSGPMPTSGDVPHVVGSAPAGSRSGLQSTLLMQQNFEGLEAEFAQLPLGQRRRTQRTLEGVLLAERADSGKQGDASSNNPSSEGGVAKESVSMPGQVAEPGGRSAPLPIRQTSKPGPKSVGKLVALPEKERWAAPVTAREAERRGLGAPPPGRPGARSRSATPGSGRRGASGPRSLTHLKPDAGVGGIGSGAVGHVSSVGAGGYPGPTSARVSGSVGDGTGSPYGGLATKRPVKLPTTPTKSSAGLLKIPPGKARAGQVQSQRGHKV